MTSEIRNADPFFNQDTLSFIEEHFVQIAMAVSAFVLFILQPISLCFGVFLGFFAHYHFEPNVVVIKEGIITPYHATFAIISAIAALLRLAPGSSSGDYIFESIPIIFSTAFGSSAFLGYSFSKSFFH